MYLHIYDLTTFVSPSINIYRVNLAYNRLDFKNNFSFFDRNPIMPEGPSDLELRRRQFKPQMSTVQTRRQQAVCVRRAYKRYGTKTNPFVILEGLNMTVPKGAM